MGSNKPHARGKPQRHDKIKPVLQHNTQPRPTTVGTPHVAPTEPQPSVLPPVAPPLPTPPKSPLQDVTGVIMPIIPQAAVPHVEEPAPPALVAPREKESRPLVEPPSLPVVPVPHGANESVMVRHGGQHTPTPPGELTPMFAELRDLFARDRVFASRQDTARCGICYLTFTRDQLVFRETDGFYACPVCDASLGQRHLPMLRRQRK